MLLGVYQPQQSFNTETVGNGTRSNSVGESNWNRSQDIPPSHSSTCPWTS